MRRVGHELLACVVELRELHAHAVEGVGELSDLVVAVIDDRRVEVASGDSLRRSLEPPQPVREHPGRREPEHEREREREAGREQRRPLDELDGGERVRERRLEEEHRVEGMGTATSA